MKLDMTQMLSDKVNKIEFDYLIPVEFDENDEKAIPVIPPDFVEFTDPIHVFGTIVNTAGYMALNAFAEIKYLTECARCLNPVTGVFSMDFSRTVAPRGTLQNEEADEYVIIDDGKLDIDEQLVEELMLEFPMRFLCSEDCKGICQKCGQNLNEKDCGCANKKEIDPRLAILQKLLENSDEM